jgi:hypothetical protein
MPIKSIHLNRGSKQESDGMKRIILSALAIFAFALSACGSASPANTAQVADSATQAPAASQPNATAQPASAGNNNPGDVQALPAEYRLILGIFKLEGTDQAVTASQAKTLLPLWQQIQALSPSMGPGQGNPPQGQSGATPAAPIQKADSSDAQQQIDALVKQVQAAMSSDQIKAIEALQVTQDSAMTILKDQGTSMGGPGGGAGNGQLPAQGTPPAGNGQAQPGSPPTGNEQGTPRAGIAQFTPAAGQPRQGNFVPPQLIDALMKLLQNRISGTTG